MKCLQSTTDRAAQASVFVNGQVCDEYGAHQIGSNFYICYVPVSDKDQLTVKSTLNGATPKARLDLWIDGILRNYRKIRITGNRKHAQLNFDEAYDVDEDNLKTCRVKFKKNRVGPISGATDDSYTDSGLGTICLRFSVADEIDQKYNMDKFHATFAEASSAGTQNHSAHGNRTHRVMLNEISRSARNHRPVRCLELSETFARPGTEPWCWIRATKKAKAEQLSCFTYQSGAAEAVTDASSNIEQSKKKMLLATPTAERHTKPIRSAPEQGERKDGSKPAQSVIIDLEAASVDLERPSNIEQQQDALPSSGLKRRTSPSFSTPNKRVKADLSDLRTSLEEKWQSVAKAKERAAKARAQRAQQLKDRDEAAAKARDKAEEYRRVIVALDEDLQSIRQEEKQASRDAEAAAKETQEFEEEVAEWDDMMGEQQLRERSDKF
ncbi:MAG: hypothetical protein M1822_003196 [Bathelium mastoideum]|nr:MAG: hypothetical protein M1822_003196 [Bathelium mastoideum]